MQALDRGSREVARGFGKAAVLTHHEKSSGGVALESDDERLVAHMFNVDPDVGGYDPQAFAVELTTGSIAWNDEEKASLRARARRHGSKAIFYTPDFMLRWTSGIKAAVEVKFEKFLGDGQYQKKLELAQRILYSLGFEFLQIVTPSSYRHPLRTNLPLLHQANKRRDLWPGPEISDRIQALHEGGAKTMGHYLGGLDLDARMGPLLLVSGHLEADVVEHALCFATPVSPAFGDLSHLQLVGRVAK
ncbi:TnsA endonuclease N-terminal domain-containing protein [Hydrogenophaga sp.]|uniref:TnsA endonuclease N-terminal domain-containing protein n=1 Tax=Hydrogenophaga sp. TaxID=1904254 RepID=UPI003AFA001E